MFSSHFFLDQDICWGHEDQYSFNYPYPVKDNINLNLKLGNTLGKTLTSPVLMNSFNKKFDSDSMTTSSSSSPFLIFDSESFNPDFMDNYDHNQQHYRCNSISELDNNSIESVNMTADFINNFAGHYVESTSANNLNDITNFLTNSDTGANVNSNSSATSTYSITTPPTAPTTPSSSPKDPPLDIKTALKLATNAINGPTMKKFDNITDKLLKKFPKSLLIKKFPNDTTINCSHCNKNLINYLDLASHIDQHKLIRPHKCPISTCPFNLIGFEKKAFLRHHLISQHFKKGYLLSDFHQFSEEVYSLIYKCNEKKCGKCFYRKDSLSRHIRLVNNNKLSKFNKKIEKEKQIFRIKRRGSC